VKVRFRSEHDFLQDDSEAVDVSFLSSVDRSSCHTQQLRCCPQLIAVKLILVHLCVLIFALCFIVAVSFIFVSVELILVHLC